MYGVTLTESVSDLSDGLEYAIPMVALNMASFSLGGIYSVCSDENTLTSTALEYLYSLGHRKIAVILVNTEKNPIMREREEICRRFFKEKNISGQCFKGVNTPEISIANLTDEAIAHGVTAIFGTSEYMAHKILGRLFALKVKVPEMCSVIGLECEDSYQFALIHRRPACLQKPIFAVNPRAILHIALRFTTKNPSSVYCAAFVYDCSQIGIIRILRTVPHHGDTGLPAACPNRRITANRTDTRRRHSPQHSNPGRLIERESCSECGV